MSRTVIDKRYKVIKRLGSGATGTVYKVRDSKDNTIIALKILSKKITSSEAVQRFKREFRLLTGLRHPNLCAVYDFGTLKDGRSYFTMEYVDGPNIFMSTKGLSYEKIYPWIVQLCRVLEYIHSKGLIHYDIKPGNVLVQHSENTTCVKLMDFGLAGEQRIRGGVMIRGTFPYIAPEVIKGLSIDHRADLYSLGILLYEIATRRTLKVDKETSFAALLHEQQKGTSRLSSHMSSRVPRRLRRLLTKLVDSEAANRFSRANEIIGEINTLSHSKFEFETEKTIEGYLLSSKFVGREKEMVLLTKLYEKAQRGEGKIVLITGDAGIGKSRLLKEFRIFIQLKHGHCFTGYAYKDKTKTLEAFHDVFRELINYISTERKLSFPQEIKMSLAVLFKIYPDLTHTRLKRRLPKLVPLEPPQEKLRNFEALCQLIKYCAHTLGELVILLEDLHWVDDLTIQFLEYLGRNIAGITVIVFATCRDKELKENKLFRKMVTNFKNKSHLTEIKLSTLKFESLYLFLDSTITPRSTSLELVRYLMKKTGGNPFFVEEIMRALLQRGNMSIGEIVRISHFQRMAIPKTIEQVILKRSKDLNPESQKVLKFAAILRKAFSYSMMKQLVQLDDSKLSAILWHLKRRQILIENRGEYQLYHTLLTEVLTKRLHYREKQFLNHRVGTVLETINRGNLEHAIEDLASHFINAGKLKKGIRYGLRAAKKSSARYANEQAIRFYKDVLRLLATKEQKRRFVILRDLAEVEFRSGQHDDALEHYNKAIKLSADTFGSKIKMYIKIGDVYSSKGESLKALHIYHRGLTLVKKMRRGSLRTLLHADINVRICRTHQIMGDYKRLSKFHFDGPQLVQKFRGKTAIALQGRIYHAMGTIESIKEGCNKMNDSRAIYYYEKAYKYYKMIKSEDRVIPILNNLGIIYRRRSDLKCAFKYYHQAVKLSEKIGDHYGISINLVNLGDILKDRGHYSKALLYFQRALAIAKKIDNPSMIGASLLGIGECFFQFCNYRKAQQSIEHSLKIFKTIGWKERQIYSLHCIGNVFESLGEYDSALRFYRRAFKISKIIDHPHGVALLSIDIGSVLISIGLLSDAQKYINAALRIIKSVMDKETKELEVECYRHYCFICIIEKNYTDALQYYKKGVRLANRLRFRKTVLQFSLLLLQIKINRGEYAEVSKFVNKTLKVAHEIKTKELYIEALLLKAMSGQNLLSNVESIGIFKEAEKGATEIDRPESIWKVSFEQGKFFHNNGEYIAALEYYEKCHIIFDNVVSKMKNESDRMSYLNRPDRLMVATAICKIEKSLD